MKKEDDILKIQKVAQSRLPEYLRKKDHEFGHDFSDHMIKLQLYTEDWQDEFAQVLSAEILPYGPITLSPATVGHHYSQIVFEGFMAYINQQGELQLFRPRDHLHRFNQGAQRLGMPRVNTEFLLYAISKLVELDSQWIDPQAHRALYLRPILFAAEPYIGVRQDIHQFMLIVMAAPHLSYGDEALRLYVPRWAADGSSPEFMRSYPGGTGDIKASANYAGTIAPLRTAQNHGCNDILWLDPTGAYVEEVGTSNVFFKIGDTVVTPPLDGTILPGITRASVIALLQAMGIPLVERPITLAELFEAGDTLQEAFTTGTAAIIKPIKEIDAAEGVLALPKQDDPLTMRLRRELQGIRWGEVEDRWGWNHKIQIP